MQVLDLKTGIDFGAGGNLKEFSPTGFAPVPDNVSSWSEAYLAELVFRLPPLRVDLRFTVEVFPYLGDGRLLRQDCWIYLNGLFVHYQAVKTPLQMMFTLSRELFRAGANRLSFALPNATAPKELDLGEDQRLLGLAFVTLSAGDAAAPAPAPRLKAERAARDAAATTPSAPQPASAGRGATKPPTLAPHTPAGRAGPGGPSPTSGGPMRPQPRRS